MISLYDIDFLKETNALFELSRDFTSLSTTMVMS